MKRLFDLIFVAFSLPAVVPAVLIISLLIRHSSGGPIFFRQNRVGLKEKVFRLYKFRTMVNNAEEMGSSVTTSKDPRITSIGKILRKTKLDELPQVFSVITGDMSLVGPRPDVLEIVNEYTPDMRGILSIRPGITSVATLHLRNEEELLAEVLDPDRFYKEVLVPLKVRMSMEHVNRKSFAFDMKILFQTIWMLTFGHWRPIKEHPAIIELKRNLL